MDEERVAPPRAWAVLAVAIACGLAVGFLELSGVLVGRAVGGVDARLGKELLHRHFLWMTPTSSLLVFGLLGLPTALLSRFRPRLGWRLASFGFGYLIPLTLILPIRGLHWVAAVMLAVGIALWLAPWIEARGARFAARGLPALLGLWLVLIGFVFGRAALHERAALRHMPRAQPGAPNVLFVVLDTLRADALSCYGAQRETTPNLTRLAARGVRFQNARSTAPWTLPSHASLFTGRMPSELHVGPSQPLDATYPTLAEHLGAQGYATGGFVANFIFGMPDYGLDRGFAHYDDRPVTLDDVLGSSGLGRRVAAPGFDLLHWGWSHVSGTAIWYNPVDPYFVTHRRDATEISQSFLQWADQVKRRRRPFFAFLNLLDTHAPYLPPATATTHFGRHIESWSDYQTLRNWDESRSRDNLQKDRLGLVSDAERTLARDSYDDCIASLDRDLQRLVDGLEARGLLQNTLIVITADHGENFGEHALYSHGTSLHRPELDVPLLIVWPGQVPEGQVIAEPVSLRDVPATIVDLVGLGREAPFPGHSLARRWHGDVTPEPVFSEYPELGMFAVQEGTKVFIHYADGVEQFFDHSLDPAEIYNIIEVPNARYDVTHLRAALGDHGSLRR